MTRVSRYPILAFVKRGLLRFLRTIRESGKHLRNGISPIRMKPMSAEHGLLKSLAL